MQDKNVADVGAEDRPPQIRGLLQAPQGYIVDGARKSGVEYVSEPNHSGRNSNGNVPGIFTFADLSRQQFETVAQTVPGGAGNIQDIYPLSPLQEGMLFHHMLNERSDTYILSTLIELQSRADINALVRSLQRVVDRHDILRTAFLWINVPRPLQIVYRRAEVHVDEVALDATRDSVAQVKEWMIPRGLTFILQQAPLVRVRVGVDLVAARVYALIQIHHLVCDHQSLGALVEEAIASLDGRADALQESTTSHRDHVIRALEPSQIGLAESYFRAKLADIDEPTAPFGLTDVHGDGSQIEQGQLELDSNTARRLRACAREIGLSPARLFHAAWAMVVAWTSGRDDVVFGTVILAAQQRSARVGRALGLFVNTLPLRLRLRGATARDLVWQVQRELSELLNHEDASLALAQRCSGVSASVPLFSSLLNYRHSVATSQANRASVTGVRVLATGEAWTNYPVTMLVDHSGDSFLLTAQTDRRIDPLQLAAYLCQAVASLVEALERTPERPILSLTILPEHVRHQIVEGHNSKRSEYPQEKLVHRLIEEQVERTPNAVAVVYERHSLTYNELNGRANQLARYLREKGVGPDQLVGICLDRSVEMVLGLLGILKAGGAYVPLDPSYPAERLQNMLKTASPWILLTQEKFKSTLVMMGCEVIALDDGWQGISRRDDSNVERYSMQQSQTNLAYLIYTSGSTGNPKGAMNEHRGVVNRLLWMQQQYRMGGEDRVLQKTPFGFDVSVWEFFWTLQTGACLIVARPEGHKDPIYLAKLIDESGVTRLHFVPSMLRVFLDQQDRGSCTSVCHVVCSGEELSAGLQNDFLVKLPHARLSNLYGPTEAAVDVTYWECDRQEEGSRVPIGHPISNIRMYVLGPNCQPVPIGVAGEIYIGGVGVGRGYVSRPDLTAERFVADPFSPDMVTRMYRTGDLGRWRPDGSIEYLGRNDHQVKIRGVRIELGEIETHLTRNPRVKEAVVIAREDVRGEKRLVAYVTTDSEADAVSLDELRAHSRSALPEYMVPSAFVLLGRLPLTANGKLDRRALPSPDLDAYVSRQYTAPQGDVEEILAGIWQDLLGVERVGRWHNFFELGGHSLLIVQMMERLRRLGLSAEIRLVFESSTLSDLASVLTRETKDQFKVPPNLIPDECGAISPQMLPLVDLESPHIERIVQAVPGGAANIQDIYPLAPLQEGILFHHLLDKHRGDTYILSTVLWVSSRERLEDLIAGLQAAIDRHDNLRTAILWDELPRPVQVVYRQAVLPVEQTALERDRSSMEQIREWINPERQWLDLQRAPLLRLKVAPDAHGAHWYVLLQVHHITYDHVTAEVVVSEVVACLQGRTPIPRKSVPYRDHVAQALAHARTHDARLFFLGKLGDIHESTAPFGLTGVHGDGSQIDEAGIQLSQALAQRVRVQARRLGVSVATLFHAAWGLVVAHTSGRDDVVFGSLLLGRLHERAGGEPTLGMFINTLPLRLRLRGVTAKELVEQTQRELVALLSHEQTPLAVAQRCSGIVGSSPLFSALLNYRHSSPKLDAGWSSARGIKVLIYQERTNYPITISVDDVGNGFSVTAQTDRRIDSHRVAGYLCTALQSLSEALDQAPRAQTLALSLSILPESERNQVVQSFNMKEAHPRDKLLHELLEEQVERRPEAIAVVCGGEQVTYAELNGRANQLARYLRKRGVAQDHLVALCVERGVEIVVGLLGILKSGGAYVPLDPAYPADRLAYTLTDAAPKVLLTQGRWIEGLAHSAAEEIALDTDWPAIACEAPLNLDPKTLGLRSNQLAYVIYTSGSTGQPKGVMVEHRNVSRLFDATAKWFDFSEQDVWTLFHSLAFDFSVWELWGALRYGGRVVVVPYHTARSPEAFYHLVCAEGVTVLNQTPSAFAQLIEAQEQHSEMQHSLRVVVFGGEALELRILRPWVQRNGAEKPQLVNMYGITETTVHVTYRRLTEQEIASEGRSPVGKPIPDLQVYLLDKNRQPVPIAVVGEIYVGGAGIARGYLNRAQLTAERFLPDPFSANPQALMYRSGDLGRWRSDGTIDYMGRNDHQVKIRGFRIELGEIEVALVRYADVKEAVVLAREDVLGDKRLVAYVVLKDSIADGYGIAEALRAHLRAVLPEHMVPSAFVPLDRFPLTSNGKLDQRAFPAPAVGAFVHQHYEAPRGNLEETLASIWKRLLGVKRVGRQDNFFDLGGHSMLVLKAISAIRQSIGCTLNVTDIYRTPTLQELAARISGGAVEDEHLDLSREATLEDEVVAKPGLRCVPEKAVLLTGGTGFVGRFLLAQLLQDTDATVYCLVRARSEHLAATRIRATLSKWDLWRDEWKQRIVAIPGDLRLPRLGIDQGAYQFLSQKVDSIYHCGTSMNHLETYAMAKPANVDAVRELVGLATSGKPKLINYISTLSVFGRNAADHGRVIDEESSIDREQHQTSDGYAASKWVGEKIILIASERQIPCNIFRLGLVWADTQMGRYDELQHGYRLLKSSLLSGCGIENYQHEMPPTPVDYVARAVVYLANRHSDGRGVFHISSSEQMADGVFERCQEVAGTSIRLVPLYDWICEMRRLHQTGRSLPVVPLFEFAFSMNRESFSQHQLLLQSRSMRFGCAGTHKELERAGIVAPVFNDDLLRLCLESMFARDLELHEVPASHGRVILQRQRVGNPTASA
ncbi:MAG TPA: amino acid adenylation domain-containing protein [Steroidobacteraceae bacterium]